MKKIAEGVHAEIYEWGPDEIVKLYRDPKDASRLEFELEITRFLKGEGLPVPGVKGQVQVNGRHGIIFQYVNGQELKKLVRGSPWLLFQLARMLADLHAQIHEQIVPDLPSQTWQLERLIEENTTLPKDLQWAALAALQKLPDGNALCHGDFCSNNVIVSSSRLIVVDWEKATRGNPLADVARTSLFLRLGQLPPGWIASGLLHSARILFHKTYLSRYLRRHPASRQEIKDWELPVGAASVNGPLTTFKSQILEFLERLQCH